VQQGWKSCRKSLGRSRMEQEHSCLECSQYRQGTLEKSWSWSHTSLGRSHLAQGRSCWEYNQFRLVQPEMKSWSWS
jgi:hypothetical protein